MSIALRCIALACGLLALQACSSSEDAAPPAFAMADDILLEDDDLGEADPFMIDEDTAAIIELPDG